MKVSGFGSITSTSGTSKKQGVSSAGQFSELLAAAEATDASPVGQTSDIAATSALNNLLALQEISEEEVQRKKLVQQGHNLLDVLEKLRRQLLAGSLPLHMLQDINRQVSIHKQMVNDPKLTEIIEDIELRAAVELAKLQLALHAQG